MTHLSIGLFSILVLIKMKRGVCKLNVPVFSKLEIELKFRTICREAPADTSWTWLPSPIWFPRPIVTSKLLVHVASNIQRSINIRITRAHPPGAIWNSLTGVIRAVHSDRSRARTWAPGQIMQDDLWTGHNDRIRR